MKTTVIRARKLVAAGDQLNSQKLNAASAVHLNLRVSLVLRNGLQEWFEYFT